MGLLFDESILLKSIANLKPPAVIEKQISDSQKLINELKKFEGLKRIENKEKNILENENVSIFKNHVAKIKNDICTKVVIISEIKKRLLDDEEYIKHLKNIRNFKFGESTYLKQENGFDEKALKEKVLKEIKNFDKKTLKQVYIEDFYVPNEIELRLKK